MAGPGLRGAAAPTRLFSGLPDGVELQRVGLVEAIETVTSFLGPSQAPSPRVSQDPPCSA